MDRPATSMTTCRVALLAVMSGVAMTACLVAVWLMTGHLPF